MIRGYKLHSEYAPLEGYRYDGLYTVEKVDSAWLPLRYISLTYTQAWQEPGMNPGGYLVCKFALKRVPGQPPLPIRPLESADAGEDEEGEDDDEVESEDDGEGADVKVEDVASDAPVEDKADDDVKDEEDVKDEA